MSVASPSRAAFPLSQEGRHPRLHFRGLLRLHSNYGPLDRSTAQGGLCHRASIHPVTRTNRLPATRSNRQLSGWFLPPLAIRAFWAHCDRPVWGCPSPKAFHKPRKLECQHSSRQRTAGGTRPRKYSDRKRRREHPHGQAEAKNFRKESRRELFILARLSVMLLRRGTAGEARRAGGVNRRDGASTSESGGRRAGPLTPRASPAARPWVDRRRTPDGHSPRRHACQR